MKYQTTLIRDIIALGQLNTLIYFMKYCLWSALIMLAILFVTISAVLLAWPILAIVAAKYFS